MWKLHLLPQQVTGLRTLASTCMRRIHRPTAQTATPTCQTAAVHLHGGTDAASGWPLSDDAHATVHHVHQCCVLDHASPRWRTCPQWRCSARAMVAGPAFASRRSSTRATRSWRLQSRGRAWVTAATRGNPPLATAARRLFFVGPTTAGRRGRRGFQTRAPATRAGTRPRGAPTVALTTRWHGTPPPARLFCSTVR